MLRRLGRAARGITVITGEARVWRGRGFALARLRRHEEALTSLDRAALDPDLSDVQRWRADAFLMLGRWDEALAAYDAALGQDPADFYAWGGRWRVLRHQRRWRQAFAALARAMALVPRLAAKLAQGLASR